MAWLYCTIMRLPFWMQTIGLRWICPAPINEIYSARGCIRAGQCGCAKIRGGVRENLQAGRETPQPPYAHAHLTCADAQKTLWNWHILQYDVSREAHGKQAGGLVALQIFQ
jgi:hypothetical protein